MKTILHVGCGKQSLEVLPPFDFDNEWRQIRVDIDPSVSPDVVASITDLSPIEDDSVECVFSKHNIEHLESHQVPVALSEFYRVLKPEGFLVIRCPDLRAVAEALVEKEPEEDLFVASVYGKNIPVSLIDIIYGSRQEIAEGNFFMAHRTGFTDKSIFKKIIEAGFERARVIRVRELMELRCVALKKSSDNLFHSI